MFCTERLKRKSSRSLFVQLWSIFTSKEVGFFLSWVFSERLLESAVDWACGTRFRILSAIGLMSATGTMFGQPAGLAQAGLNASTVVLLGPGTVATPGADVATNCDRFVPSGLPVNGLYIGLPPADRSPLRNASVGTVTRLNCPRTSLMCRISKKKKVLFLIIGPPKLPP